MTRRPENFVPMLMSGFCRFATATSHEYCVTETCTCECHQTATASAPVILDLPPLFYDDHVGRGLPAGREVKRMARSVRVELDRAAFDELLSDASFYVAMGESEFSENRGVVRSARATVTALRQAAFS